MNQPADLTNVAATPVPSDPPPPADHAMIDLETLGRRPFVPILSIGACAMRLDNNDVIEDMFFQPITLESCFAAGLRADASTITWWMTHESITPEARAASFSHPNAVSLPLALDAFTEWLQSRPLQLWGNSARFDLGILESAYVACGKEPPWEFRNERCYRTVKNLPGARDIKLQASGVFHHPTHDAVCQAWHLRAINQQLQLHL
jgi:hypothetical protein